MCYIFSLKKNYFQFAILGFVKKKRRFVCSFQAPEKSWRGLVTLTKHSLENCSLAYLFSVSAGILVFASLN